jgi:hypothetical protein
MRKAEIVFGTFNSLPKGNSNEYMEDVYQNAFKPFLTAVYNYPAIRTVLYYSGSVLEWIESAHPEFLMLLNDMIKRRQVELLGGGFHDPVYSLLPAQDRIGQIEAFTTYIRKRFGKRSRGAWYYEGLWESFYPSMLSNAGMEYTFVNSTMLKTENPSVNDYHRLFISEDQGKTVYLFPMDQNLVRKFGEGSPEEFFIQIQKIVEKSTTMPLIVIMLDGLSLGHWGNSHQRIYFEGWIDELLQILYDNRKVYTPILPGRFVRTHQKAELAYMSSSTPGQFLGVPKFILQDMNKNKRQVSIFRQYLNYFPVARKMYGKMHHVHDLINQLKRDSSRKKSARQELWKAQHGGLFHQEKTNGIYDNNLRKNVFRNLIEAEKTSRERGLFKQAFIQADIDLDGEPELLFQGLEVNAYISNTGAKVFELDYLPRSWNYQDIIAPDEENDSNCSFSDAFFFPVQRSTKLKLHASSDFIKQGIDLSGTNYLVEDLDKEKNTVTFKVLDHKKLQGINFYKVYNCKRNGISVHYTFHNTGSIPVTFHFGTQINLSFAGSTAQEFKIFNDDSKNFHSSESRIFEKQSKLLLMDTVNTVKIELDFTEAMDILSFPINTQIDTLEGKDYTYQGQTFFPLTEFHLEAKEKKDCMINLRIGKN